MSLPLVEFLKLDSPCFDVRSPKEFLHAKIPGAISLPLFSDGERALVGTAYKREGQETAVRLGVKLVGPKLDTMLAEVDSKIPRGSAIRVYCWRGGMRSGFVRYFLEFAGYKALQLKGGYKAFRRQALVWCNRPYNLRMLGGYTGSGKTEILQALQAEQQQVIDLEAIACHRGSVYGELAAGLQPSSEQFENELGLQLAKSDQNAPIWVEDESRMIGKCQIPGTFYDNMKRSTLFVITSPKEARLRRIVELYTTKCTKLELATATLKIQKRLGGAKTQEVLAFIESGAFADAANLVLDYYDKAYEYALSRHLGTVIRLPEEERSLKALAQILLQRNI